MRSTLENKEEKQVESILRPALLKDFFGQSSLKKNLEVFLCASKARNEALEHVLVYGPSGLGKTTIANIIANELHQKLLCINGPTIERIADMASILSSLEPGQVLFIDEIHRIPKVVEEFLYGAMEDYKINILIPHDKDTQNLELHLPPFTIVGATTKISCLSWPLRQRFGIHFKLDFYKVEEIEQIVKRSASVLGEKIDEKAVHEIAIRSRGTPRIANRILRRVRDFATKENLPSISLEITNLALERINIDSKGLDELDLLYLSKLLTRFKGGPVGIDTLSSSFGEDPHTLEEVCEPYLISIGFINRTPRGREITFEGKSFLENNHSDLLKA